MMVSNRGSVFRLLMWQWHYVALFTGAALVVVFVHEHVWPEAALPALPLAVVGGALGIFVSFRTNSAYNRWWEGRQLWGRLVNSSRAFASQCLAYFPSDGEGRALAEQMVRRQVAYVHALRVLLRAQDLASDDELRRLIPDDERRMLAHDSNATHLLVHHNLAALGEAARRELISGSQLLAIDETLRSMLDVQGGCERIKKTPMPRGYAFIAERFIMAFGLLFPVAMVGQLGWFVVPINVLVCMAFALISEAGRVLEDPFTMFWNGLPLMALSRTIEVNLRQRLGDQDLPTIPGPDAKGILM